MGEVSILIITVVVIAYREWIRPVSSQSPVYRTGVVGLRLTCDLLFAGISLMKVHRWREARQALVEGQRFIKRSLAKDSEDVAALQSDNVLLVQLTRTERNLGNMEAARERCREAMASAENLIRKNKNAKLPVSYIGDLRSEAKLLGVPDTTLSPE